MLRAPRRGHERAGVGDAVDPPGLLEPLARSLPKRHVGWRPNHPLVPCLVLPRDDQHLLAARQGPVLDRDQLASRDQLGEVVDEGVQPWLVVGMPLFAAVAPLRALAVADVLALLGAITRTPETTVTDRCPGSVSQGTSGFMRTPGT